MIVKSDYEEIPAIAAFLLADARASFDEVARWIGTTFPELRRLLKTAGIKPGGIEAFDAWAQADPLRWEYRNHFRRFAGTFWPRKRDPRLWPKPAPARPRPR